MLFPRGVCGAGGPTDLRRCGAFMVPELKKATLLSGGGGLTRFNQAAQMIAGALFSRNECLQLASQVRDFHLCGTASFLHVTTSALIAESLPVCFLT